jgi:hypothetical protein
MVLRCYGNSELALLINKHINECAWATHLSESIRKKFSDSKGTKFCIFRISFPKGAQDVTLASFSVLVTGNSPTQGDRITSDLEFQYRALNLTENDILLYFGEIEGPEYLNNLALMYQTIIAGEMAVVENLNRQIMGN